MDTRNLESYRRLQNAAVNAADRLQRSKLNIDIAAGNTLLRALSNLDAALADIAEARESEAA
jgi:hypothetical protein